jgi:hypothetical protein
LSGVFSICSGTAAAGQSLSTRCRLGRYWQFRHCGRNRYACTAVSTSAFAAWDDRRRRLGAPVLKNHQRGDNMSKILSILIAAVFAVSTVSVFAADAAAPAEKKEMKKDEKKVEKKEMKAEKKEKKAKSEMKKEEKK